ncbi:hypothetical protein HRV97_14115 [Sphingomonas sp. HHU CXW]|uniref:Uncharacterized protein n=1 Tax=Sphingomonas hominis TaxID=2741495 RepID=A0ABX2JIP5_9SPHN|nr:hypothetical protein [Sphingomonas hominis]NTS66292.1 hypothetical protein [Sphingomonas hominis]
MLRLKVGTNSAREVELNVRLPRSQQLRYLHIGEQPLQDCQQLPLSRYRRDQPSRLVHREVALPRVVDRL